MKQQQFEERFRPQWQAFEERLQLLEGRAVVRDEALAAENHQFPRDYRLMCHLLSVARERRYSSQLVDRLNELVLRGHQQLYQRRKGLRSAIIRFVVAGFPDLVRSEWKFCLAGLLLLYLPAVSVFLFVWSNPELIYSVVSPDFVESVESMYDPAAERVGMPREAESDFQMFGHYIQNNIGISFRTFAGGIIWGVGSIFFLVYNGMILGALAGHIVNIAYNETFFSFVIGHGAFELTAIAFSGAAGLKLGYALVAPGQRTRQQALKEAAAVAIRIMYGVILMLLIAAFLEAFWSSSGLVQYWGKYSVGVMMWLLVLVYFLRAGRSHGS